ncbi:MAG: hypothetical protein ABID45_00175 [Patescibacteria group bacterium]
MPENMDERQFKLSYFIVSHKKAMIRFGLISLIALDVVLGLFFIVKLVDYLTHIKPTNEIIANLSVENITFQTKPPFSLQIGDVSVLEAGEDQYDILASVNNPNEKWAIESFSYNFSGSGFETQIVNSFIMPGERKNLIQTGIYNTDAGSNPKIVLSDIKWKKVKEEVPELNFEFDEFDYASTDEGGFYASGNVLNKSVFGFHEAEASIVILYNGEPFAVGATSISDFESYGEEPLEFRWSKKLPFNITIEPEVSVNAIDENNLIYPAD